MRRSAVWHVDRRLVVAMAVMQRKRLCPTVSSVSASGAGGVSGAASAGGAGRRSVAAHVRDRQRAVAEREAGRLARPEGGRRRTTTTRNGRQPTRGRMVWSL